MTGAELEGEDGFDDAFEEEVDGEDESKGDEGGERMQEEVDAGEEVDGSDEKLPEDAAGGVGFEGEDEVGDAAEDHCPSVDEGDGEAREGWDEDGEEAGEDEKDAEGDGPADGLGSESGERGGCGAHSVSKKSEWEPKFMRRIT